MNRNSRRVLFLVLVGLLVSIRARAQHVPFYGKNKVMWDSFDWRVYRSPHFDLHYYGADSGFLERAAALAEQSYREISDELAHEIRFRIPVILYRSHSDFEQTNVLGAPVDESVGAFAEPALNRMVLPADGPDLEVRRLIKHELAHIFQFSLIYGGLTPQLLTRRPPDWAMEGYADYVSDETSSLKRMLLRDLVLYGDIPPVTRLEFAELANPVVGYSLGHAAFKAIEARWGKDGVRRLWWGLRKNTLLRTASPWKTAFGVDDQELDRTVERWLREAYPLQESRERPWRYDRKLTLGGGLEQVLALAASPSGDVLAVLASNSRTGELDLALVSAADGQILRNLTAGTTDNWQWLTTDGRIAEGRAIAWDASGQKVAAFARAGKRRTLLVFDAASGALLHRHALAVEGAGGPSFSGDGSRIAFAATGGDGAGLYFIDLASGRTTPVAADSRGEHTPAFAPGDAALVAVRNVDGRDRLIRRELGPDAGRPRVLRHGQGNDSAPWFDSRGDLWFVSDEGGAFNVWRIPAGGDSAEQLTDVVGGNFSPVLLAGDTPSMAFISFHQSRFQVYVTAAPEPRRRWSLADPAQTDEFAARVWPALDPMGAAGKPRRGLHPTRIAATQAGISSDGTFLGQTAVVFEDLLGDRELTLAARSVSSFRSLYAGWVARGRRLSWAAEVYDLQDYFLADPALAEIGGRDDSDVVSNRLLGGALSLRYPFSRLRRAELQVAYEYRERDFRDLDVDAPLLRDGGTARVSAALVEETTRFRWFGPLSGRTFRLEGRYAPPLGSLLGFHTIRADGRGYLQLGRASLIAVRGAGFWSDGEDPEILAYGGGSEFRGADYYSISGSRGFLANLELRFPLIDLLRTPVLSLGGIRGTLFADLAGATREGLPFEFSSSEGGFHLEDARATIGAGLSLPMFGLPLHFDWSWPTDLQHFDPVRFSVWLGYEY